MNSSIIKLVFAVIALIALAGCVDIPVSQYGISVKNVSAVKNTGLEPVAVSSFTSTTPGLSSINCRPPSGLIILTPDNSTYESYIQEAITDELKLAGLYDPASKLVLQGKIEEIDFNSNVFAGNWVISLSLFSNRNAGYKTTVKYEFSTNLMGDIGCRQVAEAFYPAVQKLLYQTVSDPRFKEL